MSVLTTVFNFFHRQKLSFPTIHYILLLNAIKYTSELYSRAQIETLK